MDGRVTLNGKKIYDLGTKMNAKSDILRVDGKLVTLPKREKIHWIMLNKPKDALTTIKDDSNSKRDTILKYLPKANEDLRLIPVGQMDRDTSGLLLLTNEVGWIHPLTHPSFPSWQRFEMTLRGRVDRHALEQLVAGKLVNPETKERFPRVDAFLLDKERNRNIFIVEFLLQNLSPAILLEIIPHLNCELIGSKRTEFGPLKMKTLKKGDWRELTVKEITTLKEFCQKKVRNKEPKENHVK
jgi:23S rRNA pseudouridine2605 synthase